MQSPGLNGNLQLHTNKIVKEGDILTTEEKLKYFEESTLEQARQQAAAMIDAYTASLAKLEAEHKETITRQAELQLKTESDSLKRENNIALSKEQLKIKRKITQKQNELKAKLFVEIKEELETFMTTPEYEQLLIRQIRAIQKEAASDKVVLYIDPADSDKRTSLMAATGAPITVSQYSFMGGTRAVLQERHILIDNSFATKLAKAQAEFKFDGGAAHA